jgi:hypothetical protein
VSVGAEGQLTVVEEKEATDQEHVKGRLSRYLHDKKESAKREVFRLVAVTLLALASIVCIANGVSVPVFTSILTLLIGIVVDSPIQSKAWPPPPTTPPPSPPSARTK